MIENIMIMGAVLSGLLLLLMVLNLFVTKRQLATAKEQICLLEARCQQWENNFQQEVRAKEQLNLELIRAHEAQKHWQQQIVNVEQMAEKNLEMLQLQLENMANKLLEQKSQSLQKVSEEGLAQLLRPFGESIQDFKQKMESTYLAEARERFSLQQEIERVILVNELMSKETQNLTRALKGDVKAQGIWGEIILEKILDAAGLRKDEEYHTQGQQMHLAGEDRRKLRPDVVINLPGDKKIIIDAKVSLVHYEKYIATGDSGESDNNLRYWQDFVKSIQTHIDELAGKQYPFAEGIISPEFVLMFFPVEGGYTLALQKNPGLFQYAWERGVVIVGPTTLIATLKTVASVWNQDRQNKFTLEMAMESGRMYDKLVAFLEDLAKVDDSIKKLTENFNQALNKLQYGKGNIINKAENIRKLGAKAAKSIPERFLGGELN